MGYNTPVLILNDALSQIELDAVGFVQGLTRACLHAYPGSVDIRAGNHVNAATVLGTEHASHPRVLVTHGNWMCELDPGRFLSEPPELIQRATSGANDRFRQELIRRAVLAREQADKFLGAVKATSEEIINAHNTHWE